MSQGLTLHDGLMSFPSIFGIVLAAAFSGFLFALARYGPLKTKYVEEFSDTNRRELSIVLVLGTLLLLLSPCAKRGLGPVRPVATTMQLPSR